jgi:RimJ/RimL family protein N-acetyltransferase
MKYLFTSERLGFRNWIDADLPKIAAINANEDVMQYFPSTQTKEQTQQIITRMQKQFETKGFCYFAVETLTNNEFIGFIGLSVQTYEADFTPCIDIGWRFGRTFWRNGYATEGAKRVLEYGFQELKLKKILSIAPLINKPSQHVMQKIGMRKVKTFTHSLFLDNERLKECVLYEVNTLSKF